MGSVSYERSWLDHQADRIEEALTRACRPVRVHGGEVRERDVRYYLTPLGSTRRTHLEGLEEELARALGAEQVHVAAEPAGIALDVSVNPRAGPPLLPLLDALGGCHRGAAIAGLDRTGKPVCLSLADSISHHIFVRGAPGRGKSELIRTILICLAISSRPSELQFLGIDIGGRELAVLESFPQHLIDIGTEVEYAQELIAWLGQLTELRRASGTTSPRILLLCDDVERLSQESRASLALLAAPALHAGVHILAAGRQADLGSSSLSDRRGWLELHAIDRDPPGFFAVRNSFPVSEFLAAFVPACDLDEAIRRVQWAHTAGRVHKPRGGNLRGEEA